MMLSQCVSFLTLSVNNVWWILEVLFYFLYNVPINRDSHEMTVLSFLIDYSGLYIFHIFIKGSENLLVMFSLIFFHFKV